MDRNDLKAGDRVARWWDSGAFGMDLQPLTVLRINRVTVTVQTDQGSTFRVRFADLARHLHEADA